MKNILLLFALVFPGFFYGQDWTLKLKSRVELRTWKLTSRAEKTEKSLTGASVSLMKGSETLAQTTTDMNGYFEINIPPHGDYILVISYAGCNTKKFFVSTGGVPENVGKDNYKPTISIGGFMMSKPIKGVDYIGLEQPLVKVEYKAGEQNFDKDEEITNKGIEIISKIYDAENTVIEKFCSYNKQGDDALNKKNCDLAKDNYQMALNLLPGEFYPTEQMKKVEQCIKNREAKEDAKLLEAAKKAEASKLAHQKAAEEKKAKDKAHFVSKTTTSTTTTVSKTEKTETPIKAKEDSEAKAKEKGVSESNGKSKYRVAKVIGANHYKDNLAKADNYFKMKRFKDACHFYEEALKHKAGDIYAAARAAECRKKLETK